MMILGLRIYKSRNGSGSLHQGQFASFKVPKCEIFSRSDFHDFYTSLSGGGGGGPLWLK
jgi:hypothetical protein